MIRCDLWSLSRSPIVSLLLLALASMIMSLLLRYGYRIYAKINHLSTNQSKMRCLKSFLLKYTFWRVARLYQIICSSTFQLPACDKISGFIIIWKAGPLNCWFILLLHRQLGMNLLYQKYG